MHTKKNVPEDKFTFLLDFLADPAVIVDEKGHILLVNIALENLSGFGRKEVVGKSFFEMSNLIAENKAILLEKLMKRMQGLSIEPYEISFTDKTGETRYAEVKAKKINYAGQPADLVMLHDITQRKRNERRLKKYAEKMEALVNEKVKEIEESEEKYRELINGMNDTAWVIDFDGKFVDVNDAAVKVLGYSREELLSMGPSDIDNSLTVEQIRDLVKRMPADQIQVFETTHTTKDGKTIPVEISSSLVTYQGKQAILSIARDSTERKQMEKVLRESEEKYRTQFEDALDAIFVADAETGIIVDCNRAATKLVGREKSELVGKQQRILHPPEEIKGKFSRTFKQHRKEREGQVLETQVITKNGEIKEVAIKANIFELRGKKLIQGIFRDITEQKKVEKALREAEEKYRKTIVNANVGIIAYDPEGKVKVLNPKMEEMTGFTRKEIPTLVNWFEKLYPNEEERRKVRDKWFKRMSEEGEVKGGHAIITTKEGKHRNFLFNGVQLESGDSIAFAHDITERKKMEAELELERDKLESVTENIHAGLTIISKDYRILYANKLLRQLGDVENKICYSTYNNLDTICPDCGVRKVFEDGVTCDTHEYSFKDDKGNTQWVELIVTPIKDKKGNVTAALELSLFITEKKLMQNKLEEYSQKLEQLVAKRTEELEQTQVKLVKSERLAAIGELAGMVGHDLRNPLAGIRNAAYYLKKKGNACTDDNKREMLEIIDRAIESANKIINDLLDYSREMHLELAECSPKSLLESALSMIQIPHGIKIVDHTSNEPVIRADADKVGRVFINLIKNAVDAMPEGGTLEIRSTQTKGNVKIVFADTGTGVSETVMAKLFTPLFTTKAQGMGLGLAVCKRVVEAHGGKITVESVAGNGATFTVTLPMEPKLKDGGENEWVIPQESLLSTTTKA